MSTITPLLDTLLPQVLGRRAELQRFAGSARTQLPLTPIAAVAATRTDGFERALPGTASEGVRAGAFAAADDASGAAARAQPRGAAVAARYAGPVRAELSSPAESARAQLSREGGLIASLLARDAPAQPRPSAAALVLFGAARVPPIPLLASVLGQQVAHSGVFYEAHLARWFHGQRTSEQLREEPHNKPAAQAGERAVPQPPPAMPAARLLTHVLASTSFAAAHDSSGRNDADGDGLIDDRLLPIVRQQLEALSSSIFRWQGQAWPDVDMQWQIHADHEDADPAQGAADAPVPRFSTRLSLELPRLGRLEVVLDLAGERIDVYACAASERGSAALQPATAALEQRFQQAGFAAARVRLIEALDP